MSQAKVRLCLVSLHSRKPSVVVPGRGMWVRDGSGLQPASPTSKEERGTGAEPHEEAWRVWDFLGQPLPFPVSSLLLSSRFTILAAFSLRLCFPGSLGVRDVQWEPESTFHFAPERMPLIKKVFLPFRTHNQTRSSLRLRMKSNINGILKRTCAEEGV